MPRKMKELRSDWALIKSGFYKEVRELVAAARDRVALSGAEGSELIDIVD